MGCHQPTKELRGPPHGRRQDQCTVRFVEDGRKAADGEIIHVIVRLKTTELDIVDTLIAAGIANNRAEAIRWALTRIRERPRLRAVAGAHPRRRTAQERVLTASPHK